MNTPPAAESGAYPQPRERATRPQDSTDQPEAAEPEVVEPDPPFEYDTIAEAENPDGWDRL